MPNFFSAFTSDVFRPLATILIPGAIGLSSWFVGLLWHFATFKRVVSGNHTETGFVVLLVMIFAGLVIDDAGARWETRLDRQADKKTDGVHTRQWFDYLRSAFIADPIGRRYVRTLVLRLKFELGVAFGMISAGVGLVWLAFLGLDLKVILWCVLICAAFVIWGLKEAGDTHQILAQTRAELLTDIRIVR